MVTIVVGAKREIFNIHKDLLVAKSSYFIEKWSANTKPQEKHGNEVDWTDHKDDNSIEAIDIWVNWLYGHPIGMGLTTAVFFVCYSLGHFIKSPAFMNDTIDSFRTMNIKIFLTCTPADWETCLNRNLRNTPLCTYVLESFVHMLMGTPVLDDDKIEAVRDDFLGKLSNNSGSARDFGETVLRYKKEAWNNPCIGKGCRFHDHSDGSECESFWL